ncbi:hypothetical protein ACEN2I_04885 [Flavobacterium sp. W22_SRS_FK3]|uniref:hypothetical protein n=1 Tax=Flavobacterium sp. W22_SRS_FK3 TaxID=3240275 RepID=UPI003F937597
MNPDDREKLHIEALKRWITESDFKTIIICDNSNYVYCNEIVSLATKNDKILEVLNFEGNKEKSKVLGKGYGEGEIMNYILNNSKYIQSHDSFFKVTGKLFVENYNNYLNFKGVDFAFDYSYSFFWKKEKVQCVFTNFYFANLISYKNILKDEYLKVKDSEGLFLEHVYAFALQKENSLNIVSILPAISGISGSSGVSYNRKLINLIKKILLLSSIVRKL